METIAALVARKLAGTDMLVESRDTYLQAALPPSAEINKVYISYARDTVQLVSRLERDLAASGFDVSLDTARAHEGARWTAEIEQAIDGSHVLIAVLSPASFAADLCRAEQLRALRKGKHILPLHAVAGTEIPLHLEGINSIDFTGARPYSAGLKTLLDTIREVGQPAQLRPQFRTTHVTAPPLPRNYVPRPEEVAAMRDALLSDSPSRTIAVTAVHGMGGIGKTVLAQALCHDEVVQQAFGDGIVWTTVGNPPVHDLLTRMQEVRRALGDQVPDSETELTCINRYRTVLREKAALIVVDDVWNFADVEPFLAESPQSRLLLTTRDSSIAADLGAAEWRVSLLTQEQARELLGRMVGCKADELPAEADALIRECGRLPLALSIVGAMLRGKMPRYWTHVLQLLRSADLSKISAEPRAMRIRILIGLWR